ncbi:MAG: glycosyltransferase family 4 protein, partial [Planctomycetes bacterium]|nr:glycosyltransferase family 4 protein [Planctomycetota bacterium]
MTRHVLATAFECQPGHGSEAGIGWHWALEIAKRNRLTLITQGCRVEEIESTSAKLGHPIHAVGLDLPKGKAAQGRKDLGTFSAWQKAVESMAKRIHAEDPVDLAHHLTLSCSWIGSGLAVLDVPFVWGPVGQDPHVPDDAILGTDLTFRAREVRKTRGRGAHAHSPLLQGTLENADVILSAGREFEARIPLEFEYKAVSMLGAGVESFDIQSLPIRRGRTLEILFVGRLTDPKGARLAFEAFAKLRYRQPRTRLTFIGEGDRRAWIQKRTRELGLGDAVRVVGHLSQR